MNIFKAYKGGLLVSLSNGSCANIHLLSQKKHIIYHNPYGKKANCILIRGDKALVAAYNCPLQVICTRTFQKIRKIRHRLGSLGQHAMTSIENYIFLPEFDSSHTVLLKVDFASGEIAERVILGQLR